MSERKSQVEASEKRGLLSRLWPFMRPYRRSLAAGVALIGGAALAEVVLPKLVGQAVDSLRQEGLKAWDVRVYAFWILGVALAGGVCRFLMRRVVIGRSRHIEYDMRRAFFDKLLSLSATFYDRERTGDIMERASGDMEAVRMFLGPGIMHFTNMAFLLPSALWLLVSINGWLTVAALAPFALMALAVRKFGSRIYDRSKDVQDHLSALSAMVQENLTGIRVVQAFGQEEAQTARFAAMNEENVERALSLAKVQAAFFPFLMLTASVGFLSVIWFGGWLIIDPDPRLLGFAVGKITLGELTTFTMLLGAMTWPTIALGWTINLYQRGSASMRRIDKVLHAQPAVLEKEGALDAHGLDSSVEIRGLTFRYPNPPSIVFDASEGRMNATAAAAKPSKNGSKAPGAEAEAEAEAAPESEELPVALHDIELKIEPGQTLGVVGPIGAGKSTLAKLFSRLYPIEDGKVFLGGEDVNGLTFDALRRQVGYVFQETFLFSASIADNIRYGRPEATDEEVEKACKIASLHDDVMGLPKGYQTMLGERGINLSGGQKQRAAIARALIYDPKVLILDDALSAVDSETEEKILDALRAENKSRTVIIIAHRLSTLRDADEIVVLDKGRIVERGTHSELVEAGGLYAKLHHMQQLEEELAAQA